MLFAYALIAQFQVHGMKQIAIYIVVMMILVHAMQKILTFFQQKITVYMYLIYSLNNILFEFKNMSSTYIYIQDI